MRFDSGVFSAPSQSVTLTGRPYGGLYLAYSRSPRRDTQAHAHAIVADIEQRVAAGSYTSPADALFFPAPVAMDSPIVVVRRILNTLRSLARIA